MALPWTLIRDVSLLLLAAAGIILIVMLAGCGMRTYTFEQTLTLPVAEGEPEVVKKTKVQVEIANSDVKVGEMEFMVPDGDGGWIGVVKLKDLDAQERMTDTVQSALETVNKVLEAAPTP